MKNYYVTYPIVGTIGTNVIADNEDEAKEKAYESIADTRLVPDNPDMELMWEAMEHIVQGNVFYGESNSVEVILEDDD